MAIDIEADSIEGWAKRIIEGVGGMDDFERYELAAWPDSDRVSAVLWTIRCLSNPACEGSDKALDAIVARRREIKQG